MRKFIEFIISLFTGSKKETVETTPANPKSSGLLADWAGYANTTDVAYRVANLSNFGLLLGHDLNIGRTRVYKKYWDKLTVTEQQELVELMTEYQNMNLDLGTKVIVIPE